MMAIMGGGGDFWDGELRVGNFMVKIGREIYHRKSQAFRELSHRLPAPSLVVARWCTGSCRQVLLRCLLNSLGS